MPDGAQPAQGSQSTDATTQPQTQPAVDQQTTTQPRGEEKNLADLLGIPPDVQSQIQPKTVEPMAGDLPDRQQKPETEQSGDQETRNGETEDRPGGATQPEIGKKDEDEDEDDQEHGVTQPTDPNQKPDKRQKRINRLTRQKAELEEKLAARDAELRELRQKMTAAADTNGATAVPSPSGRLANIATEKQLAQEVAKAEQIIDWCDEHADGVTADENGQEKFIAPKEIARWKAEAQKVIISAPNRRDEIRTYHSNRTAYDNIAKQAWPTLFDDSSEDYQVANTIRANHPELKGDPAENYHIGVYIEGLKTLNARIQAAQSRNGNGNGAQKQHRDIDERVFAPRVPLAPSAPEPPTREVVPSSQKKIDEAKSALLADPDGSVASLAKVFAAMDAGKMRQGGRQPVRS
jgi:hypothetical protein